MVSVTGRWITQNVYLAYLAQKKTKWWFQTSFIFTPSWGRFPIWLIFFNRVETTNQKSDYIYLLPLKCSSPSSPDKKKGMGLLRGWSAEDAATEGRWQELLVFVVVFFAYFIDVFSRSEILERQFPPQKHHTNKYMLQKTCFLEKASPSNPCNFGYLWLRFVGVFIFKSKLKNANQNSIPLPSMYDIFTYIYHILPLKTTKCR